jgi:Spy/CpxP family protein refolding chaperone
MSITTKSAALFFAVALFFAFSVTTRAQDVGTQQSNPQAQTESGMHHQRGNQLEWLSKELNLTDEQKAQVKPILEDQSKQMKTTREETTLTDEQKHEKMKQIHHSTNAKINEILTPEQKKKFDQLQDQQKAHHEGNQSESKQPY